MEINKLNLKKPGSIIGRDIFPRPDLIRSPSYLLDGQWFLCPDKKRVGFSYKWYQEDIARAIIGGEYRQGIVTGFPVPVTVPFSLESAVNQKILAPPGYGPEQIIKTRSFWYFTEFLSPDNISACLLKFGAIDYRAHVWVNGSFLGSHDGGYTPFTFEVQNLKKTNILVVLVEDSMSLHQSRGTQPHFLGTTAGKQSCTGIWQSVWFEPIDSIFIERIGFTRHENGLEINLDIVKRGDVFIPGISVELQVRASQVFSKKGKLKTPVKRISDIVTFDTFGRTEISLLVPEKYLDLWSPEWPAMHALELSLEKDKRDYDRIHLLYGHRHCDIAEGNIRLNRRKIYQKLLLNSGTYPEGIYTPEKSTTFQTDIEAMKSAGFTGCRFYQKIESPAFMYWADLLGFLVWADMPSYFVPLKRNMKRLEKQLDEFMERDVLHPSIITLLLFNESRGIQDIFVSRAARNALIDFRGRVKDKYPGYFVIDNSGFHHLKTDIADIHQYIHSLDDTELFYASIARGVREAPFWNNFLRRIFGKENVQTPFLKGYADTSCPLIISEFGGCDASVDNSTELEEFFTKNIELIHSFPIIQGFCYRQFCDTLESENGLFTLDRIPKIKSLARILRKSELKKNEF